MICAFFGHADAPNEIKEKLKSTIIEVIEKYKPEKFLMGKEGKFDYMAASVLNELSKTYDIDYNIVLAYLKGTGKSEGDCMFICDEKHTTYPEGLEKVPPRFAICHRNRWIIENADIIIAYVDRSWGGAAKFVRLAAKKGIKIINLGKKDPKTL